MTAGDVSATGNIDRSIVITGNGNRATINFGTAFTLPLDRRQIPPPQRRASRGGYNPLPLLAPDAGALPLVGRDTLLAELQDWLNDEADVSVQTLIARAGTGKTRLGIELCKRIDPGDTPGAQGWIAGFIRPSDVSAVIDHLALHPYHWPQPTLLVIDYAAAVHRDLARWLDMLARETLDGTLRLLLLDREAPEGFGWWHDLTRPTSSHASDRASLFINPERPQSLPDLDQGALRRSLLAATYAAARDLPGAPDTAHMVPPEADARFAEALAGPRFGNPLNLAMAGLIAAERGPQEALALRRLDAARYLARHELGRMERIGAGVGVDAAAVRHALGFNGLAGGVPVATLGANLAAEFVAAHLPPPPRPLIELLQQELPSPEAETDNAAEPRLGTIQPDLIGEAVIIEALIAGAPDKALAAPPIMERAYALTQDRAAGALMRLIQDYGGAVEDPNASMTERHEAKAVLGLLTALAAAIPDGDVERLETLVFAIPDQTLILREAAAAQTQRLATIWKAVADASDEAFARARAALWLNNFANRLSDLGQREAALDAAQEAVSLRRTLAAARPDSFTPDLAGSLNNLASFLSNLGQREAALDAAQEAVDLYRTLAAARPDAFTPDLAGSLNNLANRLSDLGQREAALDAAQEAVSLRRTLAAARPDSFTPDLAGSLNNLSSFLSNLGQREAALDAAQEAVDLYRTLAAARPDAFTPDLAGSLNNLANRLSDLGQREAALDAAQEAVSLRRTLAAARPDAFTPDLAMSLNNLASFLSNLGQREAALDAAQEAVSLRRALAAARPDAFTPNLAVSLNNFANRLSDLGQREAALDAAQEAVTLRRALAAARPDAFTPDLAGSLNNLASFLSDLGQREAALDAAQEAVSLRRALAAARPDAFTPDLAMSLSVLADRLEETGRLTQAVEADIDSLAALRPCFLARPAVFAGPMLTYCRDYLRRAEAAGMEPDHALVASIIEALQQLKQETPP